MKPSRKEGKKGVTGTCMWGAVEDGVCLRVVETTVESVRSNVPRYVLENTQLLMSKGVPVTSVM